MENRALNESLLFNAALIDISTEQSMNASMARVRKCHNYILVYSAKDMEHWT